MRKCRCCRRTWTLESFARYHDRVGVPRRRRTCDACRANCGPARKRRAVARTATWRAQLRADVLAVRAAHVAAMAAEIAADPEFQEWRSEERAAELGILMRRAMR